MLVLYEGPKDDALPYPPSRVSGQEKHIITKDSCRENKDLSTRESLDDKTRKFTEKGPGNKQHVSPGISYKYVEVARRPGMVSYSMVSCMHNIYIFLGNFVFLIKR